MNVYDFDNTIYKGDSTRDFYFYSLKKFPLIIRFLPYQGYWFLKFILGIVNKTQFKEKMYGFLKYCDIKKDVEEKHPIILTAKIEYEDFASGRKVVIDVKVPKGGHSGSDVSMMKDFVDLVATGGTRESVSACQESIESHLMALAAEESRLHGGRVCEMHE